MFRTIMHKQSLSVVRCDIRGQPMTITIEELQFQGRVESYIVWAVPALVKLRWYYVEYTYEGNCNPQQRHYEILMRSGGSH